MLTTKQKVERIRLLLPPRTAMDETLRQIFDAILDVLEDLARKETKTKKKPKSTDHSCVVCGNHLCWADGKFFCIYCNPAQVRFPAGV